jgi:ribokinase
MDAVLASVTFARLRGRPFVLAAAPAVLLPDALLAASPVICVNAVELPMTVEPASGDRQADARQLLDRGASAVAVTLGADGAELITASGSRRIPGTPIEDVVDTTGAGDAFAGALAAFLAADEGLERAAELANTAAALSVRRAGAREGMPTAAELAAFLAEG